MLRKVFRYFYKNIITRTNISSQMQFIKSNLTSEQKQFIINLLLIDNKSKINQINTITIKLNNLGFTERPIRELNALIYNNPTTNLKRFAAWELAKWYANQHDIDGAKRCLELLAIAKRGEKVNTRLRQIAIIEVECQEKLGDLEAGKNTIERAINELGPDVNLYLAAANIETTSADRVNLINKALDLYDLSPISLDATALEPAIENLKPGLQVGNKSLINHGMPLVSVIIAVYNGQNIISNALNSIIVQSWPNLEVIVVDDCSTDNTFSVVEKIAQQDTRIRLIRSDLNRGLFFSRNIALSVSKGEFVTTHDADDWSHPEKIEVQVRHLIENKFLIGNTSQMARTSHELKFNRGNKPGTICSKFACSFMFCREPVMKIIGFWDCVRFGADNEYIRRIKKSFGKDSVVDLSTGPLTFYRQTTNSLTGNRVFGHPGFYMGARKEYYEAQTYYHNTTNSLFYNFPQKVRPFPVPEPMWPIREVIGPSGRRHFDVILASDFRLNGGSVNSSLEEIKTQKKMGISTGLIQLYDYNFNPKRKILPQLRAVIDGTLVQMLVYGEKVSCDLLIVRYPPVLMEKQRYVPNVEANDIRVIINRPPIRYYGSAEAHLYDINQCHYILNEYFGKTGTWHPISPIVRETLYKYHIEELQQIEISKDDWVNIINAQQWKRNSRPPLGEKVRIGRHSRDDFVKWPYNKKTLLSIYPDKDEYEVHLLGGAETPKRILGYIPENWRLTDFNEVHPKDFLSQLDVFVYYTHPNWVESFDRVIIEAMATGVPVILPHNYRQLFQDAAIYAEPSQVKEKIDNLMENTEYYKRQVETAFQFVERHFGYNRHIERLKSILG